MHWEGSEKGKVCVCDSYACHVNQAPVLSCGCTVLARPRARPAHAPPAYASVCVYVCMCAYLPLLDEHVIHVVRQQLELPLGGRGQLLQHVVLALQRGPYGRIHFVELCKALQHCKREGKEKGRKSK